MNEEPQVPRTARDALITELLSDLGRVHDDIKSIPVMLKISITDSLEIIAHAVGEAESTAQQLQDAAKASIHATAAHVALEAGSELSNAIHKSLERTFEPALTRATAKVDDLEQRVKSLSGSTRDVHAIRMNYIVLIGFVATTLLMLGAVSWMAVLSHENNVANKWFYDEYKAQRAVIDKLPAEIKRKFESK